jgi:hypothetical protein
MVTSMSDTDDGLEPAAVASLAALTGAVFVAVGEPPAAARIEYCGKVKRPAKGSAAAPGDRLLLRACFRASRA